MIELRWTRDSTFHDGERNFRATGPGLYDVPEEAVDEYLDHRSDAWERPEETSDEEQSAESQDDGTDVDEDELAELLDGTIGEVEDALETGEYDTVLDELEALEEDGEGRKGVFSAIEEREE